MMSNEEIVEQIQNGIDVQKNMELLYKQCYKYVKKNCLSIFNTF